jgi:hypothetical protein
MKNIFIFSILAVILAFTSCKKNEIEVEPSSFAVNYDVQTVNTNDNCTVNAISHENGNGFNFKIKSGVNSMQFSYGCSGLLVGATYNITNEQIANEGGLVLCSAQVYGEYYSVNNGDYLYSEITEVGQNYVSVSFYGLLSNSNRHIFVNGKISKCTIQN